MPSSWPAIQTDPAASKGKELGILLICALGMVLLPVLLGGLSVMVSSVIGGASGRGAFVRGLEEIGFVLMYSPVASWIGLLIGVPMAFIAMRLGFAGWLIAVVAGLVAGFLITLAQPGMEVFSMVALGGVFGGLFWLSGRLVFRSAFRAPTN